MTTNNLDGVVLPTEYPFVEQIININGIEFVIDKKVLPTEKKCPSCKSVKLKTEFSCFSSYISNLICRKWINNLICTQIFVFLPGNFNLSKNTCKMF